MNEDGLKQLLKQADERFQPVKGPGAVDMSGTAFVETVRRHRARQLRRRTNLGVLVVLVVTAGVSAWSLSAGIWRGGGDRPDAIVTNAATGPNGAHKPADATMPAQGRGLGDEEIASLQAEIAALDAEADSACRIVEIYQAAEARRGRLAAAEDGVSLPLLPADVVAQIEIDRAAAITIVSADSQANDFNRSGDAVESYRSVLKHFPHSRWASVARERLVQFGQMN